MLPLGLSRPLRLLRELLRLRQLCRCGESGGHTTVNGLQAPDWRRRILSTSAVLGSILDRWPAAVPVKVGGQWSGESPEEEDQACGENEAPAECRTFGSVSGSGGQCWTPECEEEAGGGGNVRDDCTVCG